MIDIRGMAEQAPVTTGTLIVYLVLAFLTGGLEPDTQLMTRFGAGIPIFIQDGDWWRLLTNAYLHWGIVHLLMNSYALFLFGPGIERSLGSRRFFVLYLVAALGGSVFGVLATGALGMLAGGSGAIFGMFGAALGLAARSGRTRLGFLRDRFARQLMGLIAANLVIGWMIPQISNAAHIGGLISGFVLVYVFMDPGRRKIDATGRVIQAGWIALGLALVLSCLFPVLRWDYQLRMSREAADADTRATFARAAYLQIGPLSEQDRIEIGDDYRAAFGERGDDIWQRWIR